MKQVHIVGRKNHGKTTLVVDLVREFARRGLKVGTVKHSSHEHEWDTPGKDSHRHGVAGASPTAVVGPKTAAIFLGAGNCEDLDATLGFLYVHCDLVLIEGDINGPGPKVEVWREARGTEPLAFAGEVRIDAIVSDDPLPFPDPLDPSHPVWPRAEISGLADRVLSLAQGVPASFQI